MKYYYSIKVAFNLLSFIVYALICAIYLQIWSLNPEAKEWRKSRLPADLAATFLVCGITYAFVAFSNLIYMHYALVLDSYEANHHRAVQEMRCILNM